MAVEVKQLLVDTVTNFISNTINKAVLEIDGVERDYDIFRTKIEPGKVRKFVYLDSDVGHVTKARLVDSARRDLYVSDTSINKMQDGLMVMFNINVSINGGVTK